MTALAGERHKGAHGPGVDHCVAELVVENKYAGGDEAYRADRDGRRGFGEALIGSEAVSDGIDTELVFGSVAKDRLRIHRAAKMEVQFPSLRHGSEKRAEFKRILRGLRERGGGALLVGGRLRCELC